MGNRRFRPWIASHELWYRGVAAGAGPKKAEGRPRVPDWQALCGILCVLHTGIQWEYLPQELGFSSGMGMLAAPCAWKAGVWHQLHQPLAPAAGRWSAGAATTRHECGMSSNGGPGAITVQMGQGGPSPPTDGVPPAPPRAHSVRRPEGACANASPVSPTGPRPPASSPRAPATASRPGSPAEPFSPTRHGRGYLPEPPCQHPPC
ncbi:transposase [Streptomyces longwoodensis]|uniref:transposase n=1 Tax=Streptomyces longwoodensis TaxID=68231 RepID=UPI003F4B723C